MTELEAERTVEILAPFFPIAEAREGYDLTGYQSWYVRTYGGPGDLTTPESVGQFITDKIRGEAFNADDRDIEARMEAADQKGAADAELRRMTGGAK